MNVPTLAIANTPERIAYLYVQPLRTAGEAGGFGRAATRRRGVAIVVTLDSTGAFHQFVGRRDCQKLVEHVRPASLVVGYNCIGFDYELIRGQVPFRRPKTLDLFQQFSEAAGRNVSLVEALRGTFGRSGLADGNVLTLAWRDGHRERVVRALLRKLGAMRRLHEHVAAHGWFGVMQNDKHKKCKLRQDDEAIVGARRAMHDRATVAFAATGTLPVLTVVQNPGSGRARVVSGKPDCENGMIRLK